jgi:hypothetical protein
MCAPRPLLDNRRSTFRRAGERRWLAPPFPANGSIMRIGKPNGCSAPAAIGRAGGLMAAPVSGPEKRRRAVPSIAQAAMGTFAAAHHWAIISGSKAGHGRAVLSVRPGIQPRHGSYSSCALSAMARTGGARNQPRSRQHRLSKRDGASGCALRFSLHTNANLQPKDNHSRQTPVILPATFYRTPEN